MTNGMHLDPGVPALPGYTTEGPITQESTPAGIDLTNFARWLELDPPVSTLAGMIDLIGAELYRRHWPTYGAHAKQLAKDIRTTMKYHEEHREERITGAPYTSVSGKGLRDAKRR